MSGSSSRVAAAVVTVLGVLGLGSLVAGVALIATSDGDTGGTTTTGGALPPTTTAPPSLDGFVTLSDDSGTLTVSVPSAWSDVDGGTWNRDGEAIGPALSAAVDRMAWYEGWGTPGAFLGVTDRFGADEALGDFAWACTLVRSTSVAAAAWEGEGNWWGGCGDEGSDFFDGVMSSPDGGAILVIQVVALDGTIETVVDHLLTTLSIDR